MIFSGCARPARAKLIVFEGASHVSKIACSVVFYVSVNVIFCT